MEFTSSASTVPLTPLTTSSGIQLWEERIKNVQMSRATPEVIARVKQSNERQRLANESKKRAMRLERTNMLNCAQSAMTLQTYSRSRPSSAAFGQASERVAMYSSGIRECLSKSKARRSRPDQTVTFGDCDDAEEELALEALERQMQDDLRTADEMYDAGPSPASAVIRSAFNYGTMDAHQQQVVANSMNSELVALLQELIREPTDDKELAAKFVLFENFLANVVSIREETIGFWDSVQEQFSGSVKAACLAEIKNIDNTDAMGIVDDPSKWFVYSMTKRASENSSVISRILSSLRSRLDMISQEVGECPFCLEQMSPMESTILGCCHRVCNDCWNNWVSLKGGAAFCPLCRHEEFIAEVLTNK